MLERQEGREEGIQKGIEKGTQKSINLFVNRFRKLHLEDSEIIASLIADFNLTPEQASKYL